MIIKKFKVLSVAVASMLMMGSSFAQSVGDVKTALEKNHTDMPKIKEVTTTPIPNLYEVLLDTNELFYTDAKGENFVFGEMMQIKNGERINLRQEKVDKLFAFDFKSLNFKNAITQKKGNGKNVLVTFEDPNCGFCKKLHGELDKLTDVTIHTFMIPILDPKSVEATNAIWCSKDKLKAWNNYMSKNEMPVVDAKILEKCNTTAITQNLEFASKHNIKGTPGIFFANGKNIKGYTTADVLKARMEEKPIKK